LTQYLYRELSALRHGNSERVCEIFGQHHTCDVTAQGAILSFVFFRANRELVGYAEVEKLASISGIHLRSGCFCNVGECHQSLVLTPAEVKSHLDLGHVCWDDRDVINGKSTGATRISLGYMSNFEDCWRFLSFVKKYFVDNTSPSLAPNAEELSRDNNFVTIEEIVLFPIKSCAGFSVNSWVCTAKGLLYDREWVLVDQDSRMLTSKNTPILVTIRPTLDLDNNTLFVNATGMPQLQIPLLLPATTQNLSIRVCGDDCIGFSYGIEVDKWFSQVIQIPCRLVRQAQDFVRTCKIPSAISQNTPAPMQVSFANESQLLVLNSTSVADMRSKIALNPDSSVFVDAEPLQTTIARFRANLIVSASIPYSEDYWAYLENDSIQLRVSFNSKLCNVWIEMNNRVLKGLSGCARCKMVCTHPQTGEIETIGEPLATLATYRRERGRVIFGQHFSCSPQTSTLNVGDKLKIVWNE
jgi:molybdenum cofactor sulfurtransferase